MPDVHSPSQRSYNMSRIRGKDTAPERALRSLLRCERIRYHSNVSKLPGKPDFVLIDEGTAVFVHGCFWHRHQNCRFCTTPKTNSEFWKAKFARTMQRDRENVQALKKLGWSVIVIWECALNRSPNIVRKRILISMRKRWKAKE